MTIGIKGMIVIGLFTMMNVSCDIQRDRVVSNPIDLNYSFYKEMTIEDLLMTLPQNYVEDFDNESQMEGLRNYLRSQNSPEKSGAREAADPTLRLYKGRYYLFPSKSKGYWSSDDMQHWNYIPCSVLPMELYAPTLMVYKDELYWMVSDINHLYKSSDPESGDSWQLVTDHLTPYPDDPQKTGHDPDLLLDDDGRVYLYWGCSNVEDIMGIELDPENNFAAIGKETTLIRHNEKTYGWENRGNLNEMNQPGWNEGPNPFKLNGKYYLQYAAPGTEFDSYGDGLYVSDKPLGPYEHVPYSPHSIKPGGWMTGAGHGYTFQDKWGNWWHVASTVISQRMDFERRIGFFPMVITPKGNPHVLTEFSDYPYILPSGKQDFSKKAPWTGWMDLSSHKEVTASSELEGHPAKFATDNTIKTLWSAKTGDKGEWLQIDLGKVMKVQAIQTNFADQDFGFYDPNQPKTPYKYTLELSKDGQNWFTVFDKMDNDKDNPHELLVLDKGTNARYVRITNGSSLSGKFSLFDLRVFGNARGKKPVAPQGIEISRGEDQRIIRVSWEPVNNAKGYVLHWGTEEDELYSSCMTEDAGKELRLFSEGQEYFFRVDSFNESGVTIGKNIYHVD